MRAGRRLAGIAIGLVALTLAPAAAGAQTWSEPQTIAREPFQIWNLALGTDARGGGLAAWGFRRVTTATRSGSHWRLAPRPGLVAPEVIVDDAGRALLVGPKPHRRDSLPGVISGSLGGGLGRAQALDVPRPQGLYYLDAAANRRGDAIVAWTVFRTCERCDSIYVRTRRAGGPFGPVRRVASRTDADGLHVAMNDAGEAAVVWPQSIGYSDGDIFARVMRSDGRWTSRDKVPNNGGWTISPDGNNDIAIALSPRGRLLVAWASTIFGEGADPNEYTLPVEYSVRRGRGGFTPSKHLSRSSALGGRSEGQGSGVGHLDAAYVGSDTALVAWTEHDQGDRAHVSAALVRGAKIATRRTLSSGALEAEVADVAGRAGRGVLLIYTRGSNFWDWQPRELRASPVTGSTIGDPVTLRRGRNEIDLAQVAIEPLGATALWVERLRHGRTAVREARLRTR
jgi:hypothetical protein